MWVLKKRQLSNMNNSKQKKYYKQVFLQECIHNNLMSYLPGLDGVEVSEYGVIELTRQAFSQVDLHSFPPFRAHFVIHAVQFQSGIPSERSILRSERRNQRKEGKNKVKDNVKAILPVPILKRPFHLPSKHGSKHINRNRRMPNRIISRPPSFGMSLPMGIPIGLPPMIGMPGPFGMPPPMIGSGLPMGLPPMIGSGMPMGMPGLPIGLPSMAIPRFPMGSSMSLPPMGSLPPLSLPGFSAMGPPMPHNKKKNQKNPKNPSTAFKVKSPEQIMLKCARTACRDQLEKWREEIKPNIATSLNEEIPIYFKKKKANQKRRRLEKHELIKKHKQKLFEIYGDSIFRSGWPVSRREIREALGLPEEEKQIDLEGIGEIMKEEEATNIEPIEQAKSEQAKVDEPMEGKEGEQKREIELVLLKREAASAVLVPQFVFTS